jgi:hypothetical protein
MNSTTRPKRMPKAAAEESDRTRIMHGPVVRHLFARIFIFLPLPLPAHVRYK